jgi:hypothetical protein
MKVIDYVTATAEYRYEDRRSSNDITPRRRTLVTSFEDVIKGYLADGYELYGSPYCTALGLQFQALVKYESN